MKLNKMVHRVSEGIIYLLIVAGVLLFILYPYIKIFAEAFTEDSFGITEYLSQNLILLKNSLFVATLTTIASLFFVLSLTICFLFLSEKVQKVFRIGLLATMVSPPFVTSLAYITLFGRRGFITHDLLQLSYNPYGPQGIIMMQTISFASLNALVLIGMLKNIDTSMIKSARSLGAKSDAVVKDIIIPLLRPGIIVVALISFIRSLADFQTPTIIGGGFRVLASEGYFAVISQGDIHKAALINLTLCLPALIVFFIYNHFEKNVASQSHGQEQGSLALPRKGLFFYSSSLVSGVFYLLLILQYVTIVVNAVTVKRMGNFYWSLQPILDTRVYISDTIIRTIVYSLLAGFIGSLMSFLIIYYSQVRHSKLMKGIEMIGTLPYLLPGTFFGLGYLYAFSGEPFSWTGSSMIVIINVIFKQLAFATKAASASVSQVDPTYYKTVHDLGGHTLNEWKDVFFPMTKQGFALTFINGFIATMTTIGSIIFLIRPGQKVLTLVMFDVVQRGLYGVASVIACLIIIICLVVAGLIALIFNLNGRRRRHVSFRTTAK